MVNSGQRWIWGDWVMAEAFSVDPELLSDALERMDAFQRLSTALLAEIDSVVKNLHVDWDGVAAAAHAEAHQEWSHGAAQMDQALQTLQHSGRAAHQNYTRAVATNRSMWS